MVSIFATRRCAETRLHFGSGGPNVGAVSALFHVLVPLPSPLPISLLAVNLSFIEKWTEAVPKRPRVIIDAETQYYSRFHILKE